MPTALFTSENATEMGRKGGLAPKRLTERQKASPSDKYQARRLKRVRRQQDLVDHRLEAELTKPELDAQLIDRLAAASMRLSDQEFALANRPKPGLLKPTAPAQRRPARPEPTPSKPATSPVPEPGKPLGASGVGEGGGA